jgi:hypothetical protein
VNPIRSPKTRGFLVSLFTDRLPQKASALLLAVVLWFVVAAREPREEIASVRFAPQLDSALVLRDPSPPIRALVIGRPSEILKLSNTPLVIRRQIASDAPDTLVVPLRTGDVEVPEGVEVIVREVQPQTLTLRFESTSSRKIPVRSAVVVQTATPTTVRFDPESVIARGPRAIVARLRAVRTVAETLAADTLPHLVDLDTTGLGVVLRPAQVKALIRQRK